MAVDELVRSEIDAPFIDEDHDLFVQDEEVFGAEQNACIERLSNGATIFTIGRHVEDDTSAYIQITTPVGGLDTIEGLAHLVEHLTYSGIVAPAARQKCSFGASTSPIELNVTLSGVFNPGHRSVGGWGILDLIGEHMMDSRSIPEFTDERLPIETRTIMQEIYEAQIDHDSVVTRALFQVLYAEGNPFRHNVPGTEESLSQITMADARLTHQAINHPHHALLGAFVHEGATPTRVALHNELRRIASDLPSVGAPGAKTSWLETDMLHPDIQPGSIFTHDTGLENGRVSIFYLWPVRIVPRSVEYFALNKYLGLMRASHFDFLRQQGQAYSMTCDLYGNGGLASVIAMRHDISTTSGLDQHAAQTLRDYLTYMSKDISGECIEYTVRHEREYQEATPKLKYNQFMYALQGLSHHNRIIRLDEVMNRYGAITANHIGAWKEYILSTKPAMVIVGDLGGI